MTVFRQTAVSITEKTFGRHTLLAGATGSGKTHTLKQLIQQSIQNPNVATFCIDGHGDLVSDLLLNIKEEHKENIVFINIADPDFSFGFNIFSAETEAEKGVLASDIISSFQNTFISSGDRINAVLQKTISTLIYSEKEASILDMKRFLLEKGFRAEYLNTLDDPILQYYWKNEFSLVKRHELSPLLLRIDSYMQTRLLRNFFAVRKGLDFSKLVAEKKTILIQLSVGLIGLENSKFISNLIISKITQIAFSRASISQEQRHPIHLYIDEAHYYANTPNIEQILTGARKYSLNLNLVGQHLEQFETKILNSILTNTATQIFFRQNDKDARRIASSFAHFEADDFMELGLGEALVKIDKRSNDFNLKTFPLEIYNEPNKAEQIKEYIIKNSQNNYATPIADVKELLNEYLPKNNAGHNSKKSIVKDVVEIEKVEKDNKKQERIAELKTTFEKEKTTTPKTSNFENQKKEYLEQAKEQEVLRKHRSLQHYVRNMAQQRGFKATFEQETKNKNGRVDVALLKDELRIAIEISVTNTIEYEVKNIQKCIDDEFSLVYMISDNEKHLNKIKELALKTIAKKDHSIIHFFKSEDLSIYLDATEPKVKVVQKRIRGYRVKVNYSNADDTDKQQSITNIIMKALQKK